jgi:hypothetical protein
VIYFCSVGLIFAQSLVWVRSDPQLLFWCSLGLWATHRKSLAGRFALLAFAAGACVNTKIHGLFYMLPVVALILREGRWIHWVLFAVVGGLTLAALFVLFPNISLPNYLWLLKLASKHGLDSAAMAKNVVVLSSLCLPVLVVGWSRLKLSSLEPGFFRRNAFPFLVAAAGIGAIGLFASKKGSGGWHFIPFLSIGAWAMAWVLKRGQDHPVPAERNWMRDTALSTVVILAAWMAILNAAWVLNYLTMPSTKPLKNLKNAIADAQKVARKYPGKTIAVGCGSMQTYWLSFTRVALPLPRELELDPCAIMDFQQSGMGLGKPTLDRLRDGSDGIWLIPKNEEPFLVYNLYEAQDLYGWEFREVFKEHYKVVGQSEYFDIWAYRD